MFSARYSKTGLGLVVLVLGLAAVEQTKTVASAKTPIVASSNF